MDYLEAIREIKYLIQSTNPNEKQLLLETLFTMSKEALDYNQSNINYMAEPLGSR